MAARFGKLAFGIEFAMLHELASERFEPAWPDAAESWLQAAEAALREHARPRTRAEMRWRKEILDAVDVEAARRAKRQRTA